MLAMLETLEAQTVWGLVVRGLGVLFVLAHASLLPQIVGLGRALDLILTGRQFDTEEADRIGFVNRVVDDGTALDAALELAEQLASFPWTGLVNDRRCVYHGLGRDLETALAYEDKVGRETIFAQGFADGVAQFERRERPVPGT